MAREIKFMVWCPALKKADGPWLIDEKPEYLEEVIYREFTGLKDKNGKEIYERDILRGNLPPLEGESEDLHLSVVSVHYEECFGQWMVTGQQSLWKWLEGPFNAGGNTYGEVIGNIHENGELLK